MYVLDEYPSEQTHFHVQGYDVAIENEDLANALTVLPDDKRDIVLLAYFLDMTDQEIADKLDMVRRTVQYKRAQSLKELKKEMEVTIPLEAWCCGHREEVTMSIDHSSPYKSLAGKRTYTVEEIAKILGIGRTAAYSLVHSGVFKAVRIGSSIRVSKVSFDDWLDKQNM